MYDERHRDGFIKPKGGDVIWLADDHQPATRIITYTYMYVIQGDGSRFSYKNRGIFQNKIFSSGAHNV